LVAPRTWENGFDTQNRNSLLAPDRSGLGFDLFHQGGHPFTVLLG
jgi:hypothetical protein